MANEQNKENTPQNGEIVPENINPLGSSPSEMNLSSQSIDRLINENSQAFMELLKERDQRYFDIQMQREKNQQERFLRETEAQQKNAQGQRRLLYAGLGAIVAIFLAAFAHAKLSGDDKLADKVISGMYGFLAGSSVTAVVTSKTASEKKPKK